MTLMVVGLTLFLGLHVLPMAPRLRAAVISKLGERRYRALFALGSAIGLALIIAGYWTRPDRVQLFSPSAAARAAAPLLVSIAFVLFAAANMKTHIRRAIGHPMLIGLLLWSGVHLFANGDLVGTLLFAAFFAYSIVALISAWLQRTAKVFEPRWTHDAIAVVAGLALAILTIRFHSAIFGTGPVA